MHVAVLFGHFCLSFRKTLDLAIVWDDPRGLTGSEYGCLRIAQELHAAGHDVTLHSITDHNGQDWEGIHVRSIDDAIEPCDLVISINEPDLLRAAPAGARRVCAFWLNDTSFCRVGFQDHVDLFVSPSRPHLEQMFKNPKWREVERTPEFPNGKAVYEPEPAKWTALPLGCDTERYQPPEGANGSWEAAKISGRVVYCSSPDRGLHWLLQEWPAIKAAVPLATLRIFYRLEPWLRGFDETPYFPSIEPLRARANYVEECLTRFKEHGGMGVTLRDSVSRRTIEREMAQAEVLAFPADTTTWSEGFSCATIEACAARACPVITTCDALGSVYYDINPVPRAPGWVQTWRDRVIEALTSEEKRAEINAAAYALATKLTWKNYVQNLLKEIETRWPQQSTPPQPTPEPPRSSPSELAAESS